MRRCFTPIVVSSGALTREDQLKLGFHVKDHPQYDEAVTHTPLVADASNGSGDDDSENNDSDDDGDDGDEYEDKDGRVVVRGDTELEQDREPIPRGRFQDEADETAGAKKNIEGKRRKRAVKQFTMYEPAQRSYDFGVVVGDEAYLFRNKSSSHKNSQGIAQKASPPMHSNTF